MDLIQFQVRRHDALLVDSVRTTQQQEPMPHECISNAVATFLHNIYPRRSIAELEINQMVKTLCIILLFTKSHISKELWLVKSRGLLKQHGKLGLGPAPGYNRHGLAGSTTDCPAALRSHPDRHAIRATRAY